MDKDGDKDKDSDLKLGLEQRLGVLKSGSLFSRPGDSETCSRGCRLWWWWWWWWMRRRRRRGQTWPRGCSPSRLLAPLSGESKPPCRLEQDWREEAFLLDRGVS